MGIFSRLFQRGQDGQQVSGDAEKAAANEADSGVSPSSAEEQVASSPPVLAAAVAGAGGGAGALAAPIWGWPQRHSEPRDPTPIPASEPAPQVDSAAASSPPDLKDVKDAKDAKDANARDGKDDKKSAPARASHEAASPPPAAAAPASAAAPKSARSSSPSMPIPSVTSSTPSAPSAPSTPSAPSASSNTAPATSGLVAPGKKRDDSTMIMSPPPPSKTPPAAAQKAKKAHSQTTTIAVAPPPAKAAAPSPSAAPPASATSAAAPAGPAKRPSTPSAPIVTFTATPATPAAAPARKSSPTLPPAMAATAAAALDALSALDDPSDDAGSGSGLDAGGAGTAAASSSDIYSSAVEPASSRRDTTVDASAAPTAEILGELSEASAVDAAFLAMADESSTFASSSGAAAAALSDGADAGSTIPLPIIGDEISESFNRAFFDLTEGHGGNAGVSTAADLAAVRDVFNDIAVVHVSQVRDVMLELRFGDADPAWLESTKPALRSLRAMAEQMELVELCGALDVFCEAVDAAVANRARIGEEAKAELLARYGKLSDLIPQAFELDAERDRREPIIVEALLYQIDGVEKPVIDRLFAVGLNRLDALMRANVDDLVMMSEVRREVAQAIVEQFRTYRATADAAVSTRDPAAERRSLGDLVIMLSILQDDFLRAADDWTEDARLRKRSLRKEREQTFQRIRVSLVRLGDRDQLSKLERLPFNERIAALERYVANQPPGRP